MTDDETRMLDLIRSGVLVPDFCELPDAVVRAMWDDFDHFDGWCDELYGEMHRRGYGSETII